MAARDWTRTAQAVARFQRTNHFSTRVSEEKRQEKKLQGREEDLLCFAFCRICLFVTFYTHQYFFLSLCVSILLTRFPNQRVPYLTVGLNVYWTSSLWKKVDIPYAGQKVRNQEERRRMKLIWWEEQHCFPEKERQQQPQHHINLLSEIVWQKVLSRQALPLGQ